MSVDIRDKIEKLNAAERKKIQGRAADLIAEEMSLRDLRKSPQAYSGPRCKGFGVTQDSVSRLEFPDGAPVLLSKLSEHGPPRKSRRYVRARA